MMGYLWLLAGPAAFLLTGWYYRWQAVRTGVGPGLDSYWSFGAWGLVGMVVVFPIMAIFGLPFAAVGSALLVIARRQRNLFLGVLAC